MIIDQQSCGSRLAAQYGLLRALEIGRLEHVAAPARQQGLHPVEDVGIVVDAQDRHPDEPAQQTAVGAYRERGRRERECKAFFASEWSKLDLELAEQLVDAECGDFRLHRPGVEP